MLRIKEDKAVFVFTLDELWWLHEHLPREDGVTREIYEAIKQLEEYSARYVKEVSDGHD